MALFKGKKQDNVLPEVEQYYQAERRDRSWLAWVLALASVAVVVLIIAGLFLAGRWAYNAVTGNDEVAEISVEDTKNGDANEDLTVDGDPNNTDEEQAEAPQQDTENQDEQGTVNAPAQTTTPSNSGAQATTPRTGDDPLPSTGPASLVGIFAGVSTLAGGVHYTVTRRKRS